MYQTAALAALQKPLGDLEHKDEVFADATSLTDVLTKIEALELPADSKLAAFATSGEHGRSNPMAGG